MAVSISVADFKTYFPRDFEYGATVDYVMNSDIQKAIDEALQVFNQSLYPEGKGTIPLLYLTAHFLKCNYDDSTTGAGTRFIESSKTADGVSASFQIPEWMTEGEFGLYSTTAYGQKFLLLSKPYIEAGRVFVVAGATLP